MSKRKEINVSKDELAKQQIYIDKIRKMNDEYYKRTGKRKKHLTLTFG
jgi:tRNA-2-methylthio-N6-dimethylallyladenosine synthase